MDKINFELCMRTLYDELSGRSRGSGLSKDEELLDQLIESVVGSDANKCNEFCNLIYGISSDYEYHGFIDGFKCAMAMLGGLKDIISS